MTEVSRIKQVLPNCLTVFRALLAPAVIILVCLSQYAVSAVLFALCCFTDFLDGYLARKWEVHTPFGKTFDPMADKLLVLGILIAMCFKGNVIGWVASLLIIRDLIMDCMRLVLYRRMFIIPAIKTAKIKTALQMVGIFLLFIGCACGNMASCGFGSQDLNEYLWHLPLLFACIFSLWSFGEYLYKIRRRGDDDDS